MLSHLVEDIRGVNLFHVDGGRRFFSNVVAYVQNHMVAHLRRLGLWKQKSELMKVVVHKTSVIKNCMCVRTCDCCGSATLINGANLCLCVVSVNWQVCTARVSSRETSPFLT
jgi:hypothetical protein